MKQNKQWEQDPNSELTLRGDGTDQPTADINTLVSAVSILLKIYERQEGKRDTKHQIQDSKE